MQKTKNVYVKRCGTISLYNNLYRLVRYKGASILCHLQ